MNYENLPKAYSRLRKLVTTKYAAAILETICENEPINNTAIFNKIHMPYKEQVSIHLKNLKALSLVTSHRDGKKTYWSINWPRYHSINRAIEALNNA